jgi:hypothetical protein
MRGLLIMAGFIGAVSLANYLPTVLPEWVGYAVVLTACAFIVRAIVKAGR